MLYIDRIRLERNEIMWMIIILNLYKLSSFGSDIPGHDIVAANLKDEEEDDDIDDDDDYYKEDEEDKENPFEREPTDKEIKDEDFPLGNPEDDLIDDDDEVPYDRLHPQVLFAHQIVFYVISHPIFK